nr:MAG TPA: hypothetical protein [Caudoviricetes sp.]
MLFELNEVLNRFRIQIVLHSTNRLNLDTENRILDRHLQLRNRRVFLLLKERH